MSPAPPSEAQDSHPSASAPRVDEGLEALEVCGGGQALRWEDTEGNATLMPVAWGPVALYAMNVLQLWLQGHERIEEDQVRDQVRKLLAELQPHVGPGPSARPQYGTQEWIEDQEWRELERAARDDCDCGEF